MKGMNRLLVGLGASAVVVAVAAGATLGITTLLGVTFEESEPKPAEGLQTGSGVTQPGPAEAAQTGRYPGFSFCIQASGVDAAVEAVAKARVETALLEVQQHRFWNLLRPNSPPPLVGIGCPSEPLVARPGVRWLNGQRTGGDLRPYDVATPSFYWTFVFIMPMEEIDRLLGGLSVRVAPQEIVHYGGDEYGEETSAIFVSPEELEDPLFLVHQLTIAVGLEPRFPEPQ